MRRERPKSWEIDGLPLYGNVYPTYQDRVIQREREQLLPWVNEPTGFKSEVYYATNRNWIGTMALPYLLCLLKSSDEPRHVLEIGGGEGKAILLLINALAEQVPSLPTTLFTMTSLTAQPEQAALTEKGVEVKIPQIAEVLPADWENTQDIVMTCSLFGWAHAHLAIPEIRRVLRPGGYWVGLEYYDGVPIYRNEMYPNLIGSIMNMERMENSVTDQDYQDYRMQDLFPVVYQKK